MPEGEALVRGLREKSWMVGLGGGSLSGTYGVSGRKRLDVEEGECLAGLVKLHRWDLA